MTPLHLSIFDHLKQSGISDETLKKLEKLINKLPELESFRKMSQEMALKPDGDPSKLVIRFPINDAERSDSEGIYLAGTPKANIPPRIILNKNELFPNGNTLSPYQELELVIALAHEHRHHTQPDSLKDATRALQRLEGSPDKAKITDAAVNFVEVKMSRELDARLIDLRIRQDPLVFDNDAYRGKLVPQTLGNPMLYALMVSQEKQGTKDDAAIIKPCIGVAMRVKNQNGETGYLNNAMKEIQKAIPGLSAEDLAQIREQALARNPVNPSLDREQNKQNPPDINKLKTPDEVRLISQIRDACRAPHNEGRFDRLSAEQQDNLVAALLPGAMRWAGHPDLGTKDVGRVVMTERGFTAIEMGSRNLPGSILKTDEAIQQPVEQSLAQVNQQQQSLEQQRQQEQAQSHGHSGPTRTL